MPSLAQAAPEQCSARAPVGTLSLPSALSGSAQPGVCVGAATVHLLVPLVLEPDGFLLGGLSAGSASHGPQAAAAVALRLCLPLTRTSTESN